MNDASFNPVIHVDFPEAMRAVAQGKKVARPMWKPTEYVYLKGLEPSQEKTLCIFLGERDDIWRITESDMWATDWLIIG